MTLQSVINQHFPNIMPENAFVEQTYQALSQHGFNKSNTIASVGTCRDELSGSLLRLAEESWGNIFSMSSLAGMLSLGKTGFSAAQHHSPIVNGRERYVYIAMPHIAIGPDGTIGVCYRLGRNACGALCAIEEELANGPLDLEPDPDDIEQSHLKIRLAEKIDEGEVLDLLALTQLTHDLILQDLEKMIELTANPATSDHAVLTGIQIHAPDLSNYVSPGTLYAVVEEERHEITI